jgi:hypothetical protein
MAERVSAVEDANRPKGTTGGMYGSSGTVPADVNARNVAPAWRNGNASSSGSSCVSSTLSWDRIER